MRHGCRDRARERGFTLPEMLVVMVVIGVMLVVAVPSYMGLQSRSALTARMNEMIGAMQLARSEAVVRQSTVTICKQKSDGSDECDASGGWEDGWLVFTDPTGPGAYDDAAEALLGHGAASTDFRFEGALGDLDFISFQPDGTASGIVSPTVMTVCKGTEYEGEVTLDGTGRPSARKLDAIDNC